MDILAQLSDRDNYRAWVATLDEPTRLALFGVAKGATRFRCPTNGRHYTDPAPQIIDGIMWTRCGWCDTYGRVKGRDHGYSAGDPQPHTYSIAEEAEHV